MSSALAEEAFRRGDLATAERLCDQVLAGSPGDALAQRVKGMALARTGRAEDAIQVFKQALQSQPNDFLVLEWLQGALIQTGRFAEAVQFGEKARSLRPRDPNILIGLSQAYFRSGEFGRAVPCLESARALEPANAAIRHLLGQAYEKVKRNRDALAEYREAIQLSRGLRDAYDRANRLLLEEGRFSAAYKLCQEAFAATPDYGQPHLQAAQALSGLGQVDEAGRHAHRAVELEPSLAWAAATWFQTEGRPEEAVAILEMSIQERPIQGRAYYGLVKSRRLAMEDRPLVDRLVTMLDAPSLVPKEKAALLRALGKASEDLGEYQAAMGYFDQAVQVGAKAFGMENMFDPRRLDAARDRLLRVFDKGFLARYADLGLSGSSPIFVIGMIRSGTTLVQQILTSHPSVGDAGEQPFWTTEYPAVMDLDAGELRSEPFKEARDRYLQVLKRFDAEAAVVSNKWPMNYAHAGLLLLAYPDAKVVHVSRDPLDTAISIYTTDLGEPRPEFSYRKGDIVSVCRDYRKRMGHWLKVLPEGSLLTVPYEDLVAEPETWSRKLIEFCGLPWDDRCLRFYEGDRRINTPSMLQVRSPIYSSSIGKWKRYESWLGELAELVNES